MNRESKFRFPLRDVQQDEPVCSCEYCGGEIYREETVFEWQGKWVCVDCFQSELSAWLRHDPEQAAQELGFACRSSLAG